METEDIAGIVIILIVFFVIIFGAIWIKEQRCLYSYSNYKAEWGVLSGCRIDWNEKMTPVDIIREIK